LFGGKELLELGLDLRVEVFEPLATVAYHRRTKSAEGLFADFDGSRDVQFDVRHKACEIFHERMLKGKRFWIA